MIDFCFNLKTYWNIIWIGLKLFLWNLVENGQLKIFQNLFFSNKVMEFLFDLCNNKFRIIM